MSKKTIGLIIPSDPKYSRRKGVKEVLNTVSKILAEKNYSIIISPDKNSGAETFAKIHLKNTKDKSKLIGILYPDANVGGYPGLNKTICGKNIYCRTYELQPGLLIKKSDDVICAGFSLGVFWEMCMARYVWFRRTNSRIYVLKDLVKKPVPPEIASKIPIRYISLKQLKSLI